MTTQPTGGNSDQDEAKIPQNFSIAEINALRAGAYPETWTLDALGSADQDLATTNPDAPFPQAPVV